MAIAIIIIVLLVAASFALYRNSGIPSYVEITARLKLDRDHSESSIENYSSNVFVNLVARNITINNTIPVYYYNITNRTSDADWRIVIIFGGTSRSLVIAPQPEVSAVYNATISFSFPIAPGDVSLEVVVYSIHDFVMKSLWAFSETVLIY
jgi:hypothetical protein